MLAVDGERVTMDRKDVMQIFKEYNALISYMDMVERSVNTSRDEYMNIPAKYVSIKNLLGFSKQAYDAELYAAMFKVKDK